MKDVAALHQAEYDCPPELMARAPGVIQFLGEHTPACDGAVLSAATSFQAVVAVSRRKDNALRFYACDYNERKRTNLAGLKYKKEDRWANHLKAAVSVLLDTDLPSGGLSVSVSGDIPQGQGFASSTAIVSAMIFALQGLGGLRMTAEEFWRLVMRAEEDFLGGPSSFVEAATIRTAKADSVVLADVKDGQLKNIPFKREGYRLIVTDSRVPRLSVEAELRQRESDCRKCLSLLTTKKRTVKSLRDLLPEELEESMGSLPEGIRRRSLFILEETLRVGEAAEAIRKKDLPSLGKLMARSHDGLRDNYEVSCPEIDWLVKRALELEGTVFSRMTGKGFGGSTISLIRKDLVDEYRRRMEEYERIFGFRAVVQELSLAGGPSLLN